MPLLSLPDSLLEAIFADAGEYVPVCERVKLALLCKRVYEPAMRAALSTVCVAHGDSQAVHARELAMVERLEQRAGLRGATRRLEIVCREPDHEVLPTERVPLAPVVDALFRRLTGVRLLTVNIGAWVSGRCAWEDSAALRTLGARGTVSSLVIYGFKLEWMEDNGDEPHGGEAVIAHIIAAFATSLQVLCVSDLVHNLDGAAPCGPLVKLPKLKQVELPDLFEVATDAEPSELLNGLFGADPDVLETVRIGASDGISMEMQGCDAADALAEALGPRQTVICGAMTEGTDLTWLPETLGRLVVEVRNAIDLGLLSQVDIASAGVLTNVTVARVVVRFARSVRHEELFIQRIAALERLGRELEEPLFLRRLERLTLGPADAFWASEDPGELANARARIAAACERRGIVLEDRMDIPCVQQHLLELIMKQLGLTVTRTTGRARQAVGLGHSVGRAATRSTSARVGSVSFDFGASSCTIPCIRPRSAADRWPRIEFRALARHRLQIHRVCVEPSPGLAARSLLARSPQQCRGRWPRCPSRCSSSLRARCSTSITFHLKSNMRWVRARS